MRKNINTAILALILTVTVAILIPATAITGDHLHQHDCANGQVLKSQGGEWICADDSGDAYDTNPPTIGCDAPPVITETDLPLTINFTITDNNEVAFYALQGDPVPSYNKTVYVEPGADSVNFSFEPEISGGLNTLLVVAADIAGNIAKNKVEVQLEIARFTDMENGTVRDNTTGLLWLKDADCFTPRNFEEAANAAASLKDGDCGLSDGSSEGDWRLASKEEWEAFVDTNYNNPALSNTAGDGQWSEGDAFNNVQSSIYWSSTWWPDIPGTGGCAGLCFVGMDMADGQTDNYANSDSYYVWPCR